MGVAKRYFVAVYRANTKYSKGRRSNSILSRTIIIQASIAITTMFIKDELLDLLMEKRTLSFISDFSETTMFLIILLATSIVLIPLGLNQNQIAIAQQQKLQGFQNNQTL
jgi:hypothetical protein